MIKQEEEPSSTPFQREVILLLRENNRFLKENNQLLMSIEDNIQKIKANTN
jgi:hypothetical protein